MPSFEELRQERIKKLQVFQKAGINPYPVEVRRDAQIKKVLETYWFWRLTQKKVSLTGRIMSIRVHGGATFITLEDASGSIQSFLDRRHLGKKYGFFLENFDRGDFIGIYGPVFKTKKGEITLRVLDFKILAKALRPLPEKWHGLKDIEERFRKRYLDLLMNQKVQEKFLIRSRIISLIHQFLAHQGFLEVETPILQSIPGGAVAKPFKTHLNTLDLDLYLRIAPELYLKRLLVGGFEKVYEIARNFRNEGIDAVHNPEFAMLEAYIAYQDSKYLKSFIKDFIQWLVKKLNNGSLVLNYENQKIDFSSPWPDEDYEDLIKEGSDFDTAKKNLIQPTFVFGFPSQFLPLAKSLAGTAKADAFQLIIGGIELLKAFSELNDPIEQRRRLETQEKMRQAGDEEAQRLDEDFLEALEYGMPPAAGFGIGIDRLAALLTNSHSLREIILFPTMKPK